MPIIAINPKYLTPANYLLWQPVNHAAFERESNLLHTLPQNNTHKLSFVSFPQKRIYNTKVFGTLPKTISVLTSIISDFAESTSDAPRSSSDAPRSSSERTNCSSDATRSTSEHPESCSEAPRSSSEIAKCFGYYTTKYVFSKKCREHAKNHYDVLNPFISKQFRTNQL